MRNNIDLLFNEGNNEKYDQGINEDHRVSIGSGKSIRNNNGSDLDITNIIDYSSSLNNNNNNNNNNRQSVSSINSNLPENSSNKGLFDELEEELYKDSIDSKFDSLKINNKERVTINETLDGDLTLSEINNNKNSHQNNNMSERLDKSEDRRTSLLSNDQNSFTDDSIFNVNNSFGSNMANYSAYDSVHEINLGSNQKIENHENVLLNRMIDNQGIYNDINIMCETLSTTIKDNFQIHNNEIKNLTNKINSIEDKLNELILLFNTKMKSLSNGNNVSFQSNNGNQYSQFNDRNNVNLGVGSDYVIDNNNNRNFGQNIGNIRQNQLFSNNNNNNILGQNSYLQKYDIDNDNIFGNAGLNNGSKMNSNSIRDSQKEAEKRAEIERLKKLEAERKKREEAERKRIEEEKRRQREEAERKMKADIKRKEIMDSLFACQVGDNGNNSEKKPSLFGDESSNTNSRRNLFDD
ncbi:Uncharacterized protein cpbgf_500230 [Cryptosporidium parvum]|uniref:Uncharacterized protein n=2 Tax=Cryptosporidium TaxID=5806 RepID=A0A7S7RG20_CRYPV|nr:Uncharacterized protein CPATCC_0022030 [Cryptosporidium parvum]WKS77678.1 hypothetical protein CPCDC_5g230 [Cryptosporidium sp. 43IA8]WRK32169.1 Uncharacterized protein cpbgf_500230 [Cryptosporidium parvum]|eukprot:QOY41458.1 hypothetical protein CPATCC_002014 [Cryptosporidium parvum]